MTDFHHWANADRTPEQDRTFQRLMRIARAKTPEDATAFWSLRTEVDLSADPWTKNPPAMDLEPLSAIPKIKILKFDHQPVSNPHIISTLANLEELRVRMAWPHPLALLTECRQLRRLGLEENGISDLAPLATLASLEGLFLFKNSVRSLEPLRALQNLTELNVSENSISGLEVCVMMPLLKKLYAANNMIDDLTVLAKCKKLTHLDLSRNKLDSIEALADLRELAYLNVRDNRIRNLKPLKDIWNLAELGIGGNPVYDDDIEAISRKVRLT